MINKTIRVLLFFVIFLLASCLQMEEKMTLNSDGSGTLKVLVHTPAGGTKATQQAENHGFLTGMEERVAEVSGLELVQNKSWHQNNRLYQELTLQFNSISALADEKLGRLRSVIGSIHFEEQENGTLLFQRMVDLQSSEGDAGIDPFFREVFRELYSEIQWEYSLRLSGTPIDSLTNGVIDVNDQTVTWKPGMGQLLQGEFQMQTAYADSLISGETKRILLIAVLSGAAMLLALLLLVSRLRARSKK